MQAVILAAGKGVRMLPLTLHRPKPLVEVAGKPIIEHILDALPPEVDDIIIVVGYKAEMIIDRFRDEYKGKSLRYVHQWMPAGTAHALSLARPFLSGKFLLLNADDIMGADALATAITHPLAILVAPHTEPEKFGVVSLRDITVLDGIIEKPEHPATNLVSTGAMVLDERIFGYEAIRHENGEYFLTAPLEQLAKAHDVTVIEQAVWIPVGSPEDIPIAEAMLNDIEDRA